MKYLFKFIFLFLCSGVEVKASRSTATQHTMPLEFSGKWGMECLNTRFPLPIVPVYGIQREADYIIVFLLSVGTATI